MNDHTYPRFVCHQPTALGLVSLGLLALATGGCGADGSETIENVGSIQDELSAAECAWVAADRTFEGKIDPAFITPQEYDTCGQGYVVDIENLDPLYVGEGDLDARLAVLWGDATITNQRVCVRSSVRAIFYEWAPGGTSSTTGNGQSSSTGFAGGWVFHADEQRSGSWVAGACVLEVNATGMVAGGSYRIAASARRLGTRKASIGTYRPLILQ